jgi:hypothetical protein
MKEKGWSEMVRESVSGIVVSKPVDGSEVREKVKRGPRPGGKTGEVVEWRVDPAVWQAALKLVDGDASRLVPESEFSVRIK